ncbi:hypothetical protein RD792_007692 [Penstemon davidsonii]|uniref:Secreted protein n=1 Tax=Penstemon davidsonii TaxID=160366 RepID=A0ABR0D7V9_9LAMI|nr:hypothetical protein RD792_007692 [Penstemon davidsonii]
MRGVEAPSFVISSLILLLLLLCGHGSNCALTSYAKSSILANRRADVLLPNTSPTASPLPYLPLLLAPSPLAPCTNSTIPKLSGLSISLSIF